MDCQLKIYDNIYNETSTRMKTINKFIGFNTIFFLRMSSLSVR